MATVQPAHSNGTAQQAPALTLQDAAGRLGVSLNTLRRKIAAGEVRAERVRRPQGLVWTVYLDPAQHPPRDAAQQPPGTVQQDAEQDAAGMQADTAAELLRILDQRDRTIMELAGRVGFLQAELQQARERILVLEAPKAQVDSVHLSEPGDDEVAEPPRGWWGRVLARIYG